MKRRGVRGRRWRRAAVVVGVCLAIGTLCLQAVSAFQRIQMVCSDSRQVSIYGGLISLQSANRPIYRRQSSLKVRRIDPAVLVLWPRNSNGSLFVTVGN